MECVNHPDCETEEKCAECGNAICEECTEVLSEAKYCKPCVEKAKANISGALDQMTRNINWPMALAAGLVVALVGAVVWEKVEVWLHLQLGILAIGIGYGVAMAVMWGAGGKRGTGLQIMSLILTLLGIAGRLMLSFHSLLLVEASKGTVQINPGQAWLFSILLLPLLIKEQGFLTWIIIGIGLYQGWVIPGMPKIKLNK